MANSDLDLEDKNAVFNNGNHNPCQSNYIFFKLDISYCLLLTVVILAIAVIFQWYKEAKIERRRQRFRKIIGRQTESQAQSAFLWV